MKCNIFLNSEIIEKFKNSVVNNLIHYNMYYFDLILFENISIINNLVFDITKTQSRLVK